MRSRFVSPLITLVICAIMIMVNNARANPLADQSAPPDGPASPAVAITPVLQYQGRMTNPTTGQPIADGVYAVTFSLYTVSAGGSAVWTETKNVPVTGGLFSTALGDTTPLPQSIFNGQALWLGVKVGADLEATPRQAVLPVAYALSLVPGAAITGSLSSPALRVSNSGGPALVTSGSTTLGGNVTINGSLSGGTHAHSGADITSGTVAEARVDAALARDSEVAASYYNMSTSDSRYVNTTGPETLSANSASTALSVNQSGSGMGGYFTAASTYGVRGDTASTSSGQAGVLGVASWVTTTLVQESGVEGKSLDGYGVSGISLNHYGTIGYSTNSIGVRGEAVSGSSAGVWGGSWGTGPGIYAYSANSHGVYGDGGSGSNDYGGYFSGYGGVYGYSPSWVGIYGSSGGNWGVYGTSSNANGYGVMGSNNDGIGVYGVSYTTTKYAGYFFNGGGSGSNRGVGIGAFTGGGSSSDVHPSGSYYKAAGEFSGPDGVLAATSADASSGDAVHAITTLSGSGQWALRATKAGGGNYAGYFTGNVYVYGDLSASGTKPFKIDNPLNPANEYLYHYAVESPQVQNLYNGTLVLDSHGEAVVTLPDYFSAINTGDYRYSLTPIGAPMPNLYIAEEIKGNTFKIAGGVAGQKVSWLVYGQRNDAWLRDHPATAVQAKPAEERGTYLYPQGYGLPETRSMEYAHDHALNYTPLPSLEPDRSSTPLSATVPAAATTVSTGPWQPSALLP